MNGDATARSWESRVRTLGLALGPLAAVSMLLFPAPAGLAPAAWATAAVAVWMAIWWTSEAVPLAATALLPLVAFPLLGIADAGKAAAPFANPLIFLFLGGFWIALAMQRWGLHERIALNIVTRTGRRPAALVAGVMIATAALSMWISNTATVMMMVPIVTSLVTVVCGPEGRTDDAWTARFATALMLATAYAASIGGLATLVGSPPNALFAAFIAQTYGIEIGFARWMTIGLPVTLVMLPLAWLMLTRGMVRPDRVGHAGPEALLAAPLAALGPLRPAEKRVGVVFAIVAALWIGGPLLSRWSGLAPLSDSTVAIAGALALFVIPADWNRREFLLDWAWARRAPWEILILFGGGLSLAQAVDQSGLATWIGSGLAAFGAWPTVALVAAVAMVVIFMTELTSNTATAAAMLPVLAAVAVQADLSPLLLTLPAALAASCAFMLPVATPPNAIVFGTGLVTVADMMRAGLLLNLAGIVVITAAAMLILPRVLP